jgi:predicted RNA binding protein YcfA (HicA-like mRNA interferase family)
MHKLRPLSAGEVCRILRMNGFELRRQTGSHIIMRRNLASGDSATVPVPNKREIPKGTLKSIIDLSGLEESLFRK